MGHWIKCEKCKKIGRYDSGEIENIGTVWHPILVVKCGSCGSTITFDHGSRAQISQKAKGVEISRRISELSGRKRAEEGDIREYWIQRYVRENYKKLGFSRIEGPFKTGPDFKGVYKGKKVIAEVERTCKSFVEHGHHSVDILIVLSHSKPPKDIEKKLPKRIIQIDVNDFVEWWRPEAKAYAKTKRFEDIISLIAREFQRRFVATGCNSEDKEMSTCPECNLCPYLEEEIEGKGYETSSLFFDLALKFIAHHKYPITSDNFKLTDIDPSEINKFFLGFLMSDDCFT